MNLITETVLQHWHTGRKTKTTPSGWISANAVCCNDKRNRGGLIINEGEAISYHCFHCDFKTSWQPGRKISSSMRKFMQYLNMSDDLINQLSFEAWRIVDMPQMQTKLLNPSFDKRSLPIDALPIKDYLDNIPNKLIPVLEYMNSRQLYLDDYDFYWSSNIGFSNRLILPYYYNDMIVGYTARSISNIVKQKYISEQQPNYVFNLDQQRNTRPFVLVCEGPFDAISIQGTALLGNDIKPGQDWLLRNLNKEIILIPDRDEAGMRCVEQAIEYNWSVSFPEWPHGIKDVNDATIKLGRLSTLWLILQGKIRNQTKFKLLAK
jgi:hypothetical protein